MKRFIQVLSTATAVLFSAQVLSNDASLKGKAERLVQLRLAVDELEAGLSDLRSGVSTERRALETQKADLNVLIGQEKARRQSLVQLENEQKRTEAERGAQLQAFLDPGEAAARLLKEYIEQSIPFQKSERIAAVDDIVLDLKAGNMDAVTALSRLWQIVEDELAMVSEVRMGRQVIVVNGTQCLAETARIGMSVMYFRVDESKVGLAVKTSDKNDDFRVVESEPGRAAINTLFNAIKKQVYQGEFEILLPKRESDR